VLARFKMPRLRDLDQATGLPARKPKPVRYEVSRPGELVHVDIKKQGRIPDGGGHRKLGRTVGHRNNKKQGLGYAYLHHAVDDHTRIAYSEILDDERKETAAGFWLRARAHFASAGIDVTAVMTDNGSCDARARTGPRPTARSNASTAPSNTNGRTRRPTAQRPNEQATTRAGCITTITTDPTPASPVSPPCNAYTTSRGRTTSGRRSTKGAASGNARYICDFRQSRWG